MMRIDSHSIRTNADEIRVLAAIRFRVCEGAFAVARQLRLLDADLEPR